MDFLEWQERLGLGEVVWGVHHLENVSHAISCLLFDPLAVHLHFRDARLFVTFFQPLMSDKVLGHYSTDLFEVFQDCQTRVLGAVRFVSRTETLESAAHVECDLRGGTIDILRDGACPLEHRVAVHTFHLLQAVHVCCVLKIWTINMNGGPKYRLARFKLINRQKLFAAKGGVPAPYDVFVLQRSSKRRLSQILTLIAPCAVEVAQTFIASFFHVDSVNVGLSKL